jgi:hypothetical protein
MAARGGPRNHLRSQIKLYSISVCFHASFRHVKPGPAAHVTQVRHGKGLGVALSAVLAPVQSAGSAEFGPQIYKGYPQDLSSLHRLFEVACAHFSSRSNGARSAQPLVGALKSHKSFRVLVVLSRRTPQTHHAQSHLARLPSASQPRHARHIAHAHTASVFSQWKNHRYGIA